MDKEIVIVDAGTLVPYENNPRSNDNAVKAVARSIEQFGFKVPIVIDKNNVIITGHTRLKAAQKLGIEKVPVIIADDLNEEQVKAFRLADNKVGELAGWDFDKLEEELATLDFDMGDFGFDIQTVEDNDEDDETVNTDTNFNYNEQYGVIVMCKDEAEQEKIYNRLMDEGFECKVVAT